MAVAYEDGGAPFDATAPFEFDIALDGVAGGGGKGDMPAIVAGGVMVIGVTFDRRLSTNWFGRASSFSKRRISSFKFNVRKRWAEMSLCDGGPSNIVIRWRLSSSRKTSSKKLAYPESNEMPTTICLQLWFLRCHLIASKTSKNFSRMFLKVDWREVDVWRFCSPEIRLKMWTRQGQKNTNFQD